MTYTILNNTFPVSTVVVDHLYKVYIDTDDPYLECKSFKQEYDICDKDLFLKYVPTFKEDRNFDNNKRILHIINKSNKDEIVRLSSILDFKYNPVDVDSRTYLINNDKIQIMNYTDRSLAIFSDDMETLLSLKKFTPGPENKSGPLKYNVSLTGPNLKRKPGFILAKSSKKKDEVLTALMGGLPPESESGLELLPPSLEGHQRMKIWGPNDFITKQLTVIEEDNSDGFNILKERDLDTIRKLIEVEIKS